MSAASAPSSASGSVSIVTQTRVLPSRDADFSAWQEGTNAVISAFTGFIEQTVLPANPPAQVDWVIVQRFVDTPSALAWLHSKERATRISQVQPMLVGRDDVHVVPDGASGVLPSPVSAVISTRIKPGQVDAYRAWEQKMAAAQSRAPGFQGYRFEAPIPGVQEDFLALLRFDTEAHLNDWMASPERKALLREAEAFTEEFHARIVHTGFDQWFSPGKGTEPPSTWKQNLLVLLMLYPVVFLFGRFVQVPLLMGIAKIPFPAALFIGNLFSILCLNWLVPWVSRRFAWWLPRTATRETNWKGAAILIVLYAILIAVFTSL